MNSGERKRWLWDYKQNLRCARCGETHPATLSFHHPDEDGRRASRHKKANIAEMVVLAGKYTDEEFFEEISKCIVLCENCHRKLHWEQANHEAVERRSDMEIPFSDLDGDEHLVAFYQ